MLAFVSMLMSMQSNDVREANKRLKQAPSNDNKIDI